MIYFLGGKLDTTGVHRTGMGNGFRGLLDYLVYGDDEPDSPGVRADHISYRHLISETPEKAAYEMRMLARGKPSCANPVYHFGIALEPAYPDLGEGRETLTVEQWEGVVEHFLVRLGLDAHQAVWVIHNDRDHQHVHVAVNRVGLDRQGRLREWKPHFDVKKGIQVCRELEIEMKLRLRAAVPSRSEYRPTPHAQRRTETPPMVLVIREQILPGLEDWHDWGAFERALARHGIALEAGRRGRGLVFCQGDRRISASKVHRSLSSNRLAARFGGAFEAYRQEHRPPKLGPVTEPGAAQDVQLRHLLRASSTFDERDLDRRLSGLPNAADLRIRLLDEAIPLGTNAQGDPRYTSPEMFAREKALFEGARDLAKTTRHSLDAGAVEDVVFGHYPWAAREQVDAIYAATTKSDLALILGRPGTGKTHPVAAAIAAAYFEADVRVIGLALSGKAAQGLEQSAGVEAITFARLRLMIEQGQALPPGSVVIVDEAGMLNTRQTGTLIEHALQQQLKLVLIGDPDQLPPIGAGDPFRALTTLFPTAELAQIRRQKSKEMREATRALVHGDVAAALQVYKGLRCVESRETALAARTSVLRDYLEAGDPEGSLLLAATNHEVDLLNREIRSALMAEGQLPDAPQAQFVAGDRVLLTRNAPKEGYRNGSLGTVMALSPRQVTIRLDTGATVKAPLADGTVTHGYALTVHRAQGVTADRVFYLAGHGDRHLSLVAMTRHRESLKVYWDHETFPTYADLLRTLRRPSRNDLIRDYLPEAAELSMKLDTLWEYKDPWEESYLAPSVPTKTYLSTTNRGHDLWPGDPQVVYMDEYVQRFEALREEQRQGDLSDATESAPRQWRRLACERELHQVVDDVWHLVGTERMPLTLRQDQWPRYASLSQELVATTNPRSAAGLWARRSRLTEERRWAEGWSGQARLRMRALAASSWSVELPDFRRAATVFYTHAPPEDPLCRLIEHYNADPSEAAGEAIRRYLMGDAPASSFADRLETLLADGSSAVSLVHLAFEIKLALRAAIRQHQGFCAELDLQSEAEPGGWDRRPISSQVRSPMDLETWRANTAQIRQLRKLYIRARHGCLRAELAMLIQAQTDPTLATSGLRQAVDTTLPWAIRGAAYMDPPALSTQDLDDPEAALWRLEARLRELEAAAPPATAELSVQVEHQIEIARIHGAQESLENLQAEPPYLPQMERGADGKAITEAPLSRHLDILDRRTWSLDRLLPEPTDAQLLGHLARGDLAYLDEVFERGAIRPEPVDLDAPMEPWGAFDRYVDTAQNLQSWAAEPGIRLDDPRLQAAAHAVREARGQAIMAHLPYNAPDPILPNSRLVRSHFRPESKGGPSPQVRHMVTAASSHRRGFLHRFTRRVGRRVIRSVLYHLVEATLPKPPTVGSITAKVTRKLIM